MGSILELLGSPLKGLVDSVGQILDNLTTTDAERLEAKRKVLDLQSNLTSELAKLDVEWAKAQADVVKSEIQSQSWMAKNWRPILMLSFTYIIVHNFVLAPLFSLTHVEIPPDMWGLLKIGMGGYVLGRSAEKIAPGVTQALFAKNK